MLVVVSVFLGVILTIVSVLGYAFQPPTSTFAESFSFLKYVTVFYILLGIFLFSRIAFKYLLNPYFEVFEAVFASLLIVICLSVAYSLKGFWEFDLIKIRDILLYGSIVWLMGREIHTFQSYFYCEMIASLLSIFVLYFRHICFLKLGKLGYFLHLKIMNQYHCSSL